MFESLFNERGLSLDRLKVLIEVHDAGGIAQAAPGDSVRQSQYSRQLRELSEFFGVEVAQRRGKLLKLTPQGVRLVELAREHLRSLDDFRTECREESITFTLGAGDSLIQWLVIPRLGQIIDAAAGTHFSTTNLRTNEIVQQLTDCRLDFGIIRKNALAPGLKSFSLGTVRYVALVPEALAKKKKPITLRELLSSLPLATQTTDGQFTSGLKEIAGALDLTLKPALACQSFPQTMAAVRSGCFAAIVPEIAVDELTDSKVLNVAEPLLRKLDREAMLAWNPRVISVRPGALKQLERLKKALQLG